MQSLLVRAEELVNGSMLEHRTLAGVHSSLKAPEMGPFNVVTVQGDAQVVEEQLCSVKLIQRLESAFQARLSQREKLHQACSSTVG